MSNFKKALFSSLAFLLIVLLLSVGIIAYYYHRGVYTYEDAGTRRELAGQLDLLVCGASAGQVSVNPETLDSVLGTSSYNLGSPRLLLHGRTWLLQKELERNPVKTVLMEVSLDVLSQDDMTESYARGEARMISRLDDFSERLDYFKTYLPASHFSQWYAISLRYGVESLLCRLAGLEDEIAPPIRGYRENHRHNQALRPDEVEALHNSEPLPDPRPENLAQLQKMADLCREHGARLIVIVTPTSDSYHWRTAGEEESYDVLKDFCRRNECLLLNFDLDLDRFALYSDAESFSDAYHLCDNGAHVFSPRLAETLQRVFAGEDVSEMFFQSYAEMEAESPYAQPKTAAPAA